MIREVCKYKESPCSSYCDGCVSAVTASLRQAEAEIAELRADLVWALEQHAHTTIDKTVVIPFGGKVGNWTRVDTERDPARITAAVRSARTKGGAK